MTIREFAKERGFEIIGKLTRHPEKEWITDPYSGEKVHDARVYVDEAGNEYLVDKKGICICTADGSVI